MLDTLRLYFAFKVLRGRMAVWEAEAVLRAYATWVQTYPEPTDMLALTHMLGTVYSNAGVTPD